MLYVKKKSAAFYITSSRDIGRWYSLNQGAEDEGK